MQHPSRPSEPEPVVRARSPRRKAGRQATWRHRGKIHPLLGAGSGDAESTEDEGHHQFQHSNFEINNLAYLSNMQYNHFSVSDDDDTESPDPDNFLHTHTLKLTQNAKAINQINCL